MGVKVSVVTLTRNCADTSADYLESVARQSWVDREHVVIDGPGTDGTLGLLAARRNQLAVLVSELDKGMCDALNKVHCRSEPPHTILSQSHTAAVQPRMTSMPS